MPFISVDFNGTAGTELSAYDSNFIKHTGATGDLQITNVGRVRASSTTAARYYHNATPPSADYEVIADLRFMTMAGINLISVEGRVDTASNTRYGARYGTNLGAWELFKVVNGTFTSLGTYTGGDPVTGETRPIKLKMVGTTIELYIDNETTPRVSVTDSSITAAGKAAIGITMSGTPSDSVGWHLDNLVANDLGAAQPHALGNVSLAATGTLGIAGDLTISQFRFWSMPTTAANGTVREMVVIADDRLTVIQKGSATAQGGFFKLLCSNQSELFGTKRFAIMHNWDDNKNTLSIRGGVGIVEVTG